MAIVTLASLKAKWVTGYVPTESDYDDLWDTLTNLNVILTASGNTGDNLLKSSDNKSTLEVSTSGVIGQYYHSGLGLTVNVIASPGGVQMQYSSASGGFVTIDAASLALQHDAELTISTLVITLIEKIGGGLQNLYVDNAGHVLTEPKPLVYDAIIYQAGTTAPVTCDLEYTSRAPFVDTLGGTWSYQGVGLYRFTATGAFTDMTKVNIILGDNRYNAGLANCFGFDFKVDNNTIQFKSVQYAALAGPSTATNGIVNIQPVRIEVHP